MRKLWKFLATLALLALLLFVFRYPLMRGLGGHLIYTHTPEPVDAIFVLAGSPFDRGTEAARLWHEGLAPLLVCTGETVPHDFQVLGLDYRECDLTRAQLLASGVPDSAIVLLPHGTSTLEEAEAILAYCRIEGIGSCMVVSSKFHTRRIKRFFVNPFRRAEVALLIHGAPATQYEEARWWENEYGLLAVNNEYVKLIYYLLRGR